MENKIINFDNIFNLPEYDFLYTNDHLGSRIIFLCLSGSYSYGTNIATSDIDIRGCSLNKKSEILGLSTFDQFIDNGTDTVVYSFNKLIKLLLNCNPNCIELLGCLPEHYIYNTIIGIDLINNYHMFLSKKAINSFGGYAKQQLYRVYHKDFDARSRKKNNESLNKHIMHLFRLYYTLFDILEKEKIITYRSENIEELMKIRNGLYINDNMEPLPELNEKINEMEERLKYDDENTSLPNEPDMKKIEEYVISINNISIK